MAVFDVPAAESRRRFRLLSTSIYLSMAISIEKTVPSNILTAINSVYTHGCGGQMAVVFFCDFKKDICNFRATCALPSFKSSLELSERVSSSVTSLTLLLES